MISVMNFQMMTPSPTTEQISSGHIINPPA